MFKYFLLLAILLIGSQARFDVRTLFRCSTSMCGGIAGLLCCPGYACQMQGNYPDAAGTCSEKPIGQGCVPSGGICGGFAGAMCCSGGCRYRPGADFGYC